MRRKDIIRILDGTHPRHGRGVALALSALILLSALTIAVETVRGLPLVWLQLFLWLEIFVVVVFAAEYLTRLICSRHPLRYVFSFWGLIDLLAIVPAIVLMQPQWAAIRIFRLLRVLRLLKLFRSSRALDRMARAFRAVRGELTVFAVLAAMVLYIAAVGIYSFEYPVQPEVFSSIPKSLWWAVASLTTVGYGDMIPLTTGGRIFTTLVLFVGLGVVAGPAAIITTALLEADMRASGNTTFERPETEETNTEENE